MIDIQSGYSCTHNEYHLELRDAKTNELKQVVDCHNVVLDAWRNYTLNTRSLEINAFWFGTGSGTPAASDTGMFNQIYTTAGVVGLIPAVTYNYPTATKVLTYTLDAGIATGSLTECGVGHYSSGWDGITKLMTHALFVDSEGNPIVIEKTDTDILVVTATIYYTYNPPADSGPFILPENSANIFYRYLTALSGGLAVSLNGTLYDPGEKHITDGPFIAFNTAGSSDLTDGVFTSNTYTLGYGASSFNGAFGVDIKAMQSNYLGTCRITEEIFPATAYPLYEVGLGDGVSTEFHIKTPSCKEGTQRVYVDSVLQVEGVDYTFFNKRMQDCFTNWASADQNYAVIPAGYTWPTYSYNGYYSNPFYPTYYIKNGYGGYYLPLDVMYDFGEPIDVNCVYVGRSTTFQNVAVLQYSTDGENWTDYVALNTVTVGSYDILPTVTARYWRYYLTTSTGMFSNSTSANQLIPIGLFGYYKPSITFVTAPAADAVIEIEYDLEYPMWDSLHSIQFAFTCTLNM